MQDRFQDENFRLSHFQTEVCVVCPQCTKKASTKVHYETDSTRLFCENCGYNKDKTTQSTHFKILHPQSKFLHVHFKLLHPQFKFLQVHFKFLRPQFKFLQVYFKFLRPQFKFLQVHFKLLRPQFKFLQVHFKFLHPQFKFLNH